MKRLFAVCIVVAVALLSIVYAGMQDKINYGQTDACWFCENGADFSVNKIKDGADIFVTSKVKEEVPAIQDRAAEWVKWHKASAGAIKPGMMDEMCPFCEKGADIKLDNTRDGVRMSITSNDASAAARIQEKAVNWVNLFSKITEHGFWDRGVMMHGMSMMGVRNDMGMMNPGWANNGRGWYPGAVIMVILTLLLMVLLIIFLVKVIMKGGREHFDEALNILKKRYAAGEITKQEFENIKKDLGC
jgi:putative membrane protein